MNNSSSTPPDADSRKVSSPEVRKVRGRLGLLRARIRGILATVATCRWVVAAVLALALFFVADWFLDLPMHVRRFLRSGLLTQPPSWSVIGWLIALAMAIALAVIFTKARKRTAPFLAFFAGGLVGLLVWFAYQQFAPIGTRLRDEELALGVEAHHAGLRHRLASALDFDNTVRNSPVASPRGESRELMEAMIDETTAEAKGVKFARAASSAPATRWVTLAGLALAGALIATLALPATKLWARRSLLLEDVDWPRDTTMRAVDVEVLEEDASARALAKDDPSSEEGDKASASDGDSGAAANTRITPHDPKVPFAVTVGRPLTVYALAEGDVPDEAYLLDYVDGQQPLSRRMYQVPGRDNLFAFEFRDVRRPFTFILRGGDDDDDRPVYSVEISIPPRIQSIQTSITYPAYLSLEPTSHDRGSVSVPQGAKINVTFVPDVPLASAHALVGGKRVDVTPVRVPTGESEVAGYRFTSTAESSFRYSLVLITPEGKRNESTADSYEVRVKEDRAPRLDWIFPRGLGERTAKGRIPLLVRASDDYGIGKLALELRAGGQAVRRFELGTDETERDESGSSDDEQTRRIQAAAKLDGRVGRGQVLAYVPIDVPSLRDDEGLPISSPSRVSFRFVATDTKGQVREGEWNAVDVSGAGDIERGLSSGRASVRSQLAALQREQNARRDDVIALLAEFHEDGAPQSSEDNSDRAESLRSIRFRQGRIAQDAQRATRALIRIFNDFIYNRLGASNPNERILGYLNRYHSETFGVSAAVRDPSLRNSERSAGRTSDVNANGDPVFPYRLYDEILDAWRGKVIYDKGLIERMLYVMQDAIHIAARLAPKAHATAIDAAGGSRSNKNTNGSGEPPQVDKLEGERKRINDLLNAQESMLASLDRLLKAMSGWQSLSDLTLALRGIVEEQESLRDRMETIDSGDAK